MIEAWKHIFLETAATHRAATPGYSAVGPRLRGSAHNGPVSPQHADGRMSVSSSRSRNEGIRAGRHVRGRHWLSTGNRDLPCRDVPLRRRTTSHLERRPGGPGFSREVEAVVSGAEYHDRARAREEAGHLRRERKKDGSLLLDRKVQSHRNPYYSPIPAGLSTLSLFFLSSSFPRSSLLLRAEHIYDVSLPILA